MWFRKNETYDSKTEQDFQTIVNIVKYLDKTEFRKFMDAAQSAWEAYDKILRVKTRDEKEVKPVDDAEKYLEMCEETKK